MLKRHTGSPTACRRRFLFLILILSILFTLHRLLFTPAKMSKLSLTSTIKVFIPTGIKLISSLTLATRSLCSDWVFSKPDPSATMRSSLPLKLDIVILTVQPGMAMKLKSVVPSKHGWIKQEANAKRHSLLVYTHLLIIDLLHHQTP